jgi:hypothetical protein
MGNLYLFKKLSFLILTSVLSSYCLAHDDVITRYRQPDAAVVSSFTLINATTDADIRVLRNADTINLAALTTKQLNIRANTTPTGSVVFQLSGQQTRYHIENGAPYALFSNSGNDYFGATLQPGNYTLTATPYSGVNGSGSPGTPLTIRFHVLFQKVNSFTLVNADTDKDIRVLTNGAVIDLAGFPNTRLTIRANTNPPVVGSVVFDLSSGSQSSRAIENLIPYALFGDNNGNYDGVVPVVGDYTLKATPYSGRNGSGQKGAASTIKVKVVNSAAITSIMERTDIIERMAGGLLMEETSKRFQVLVAPNPLNSVTRLQYELPAEGEVSIKVFDVIGREVATMVKAVQKAGVYNAGFNATNLSKGVYYYRALLTTKQKMYTQTGKLIIAK